MLKVDCLLRISGRRLQAPQNRIQAVHHFLTFIRRQTTQWLQASQALSFHSQRHVRPNTVRIAFDPNINSESAHRWKRIGRQNRHENDSVEFQEMLCLNNKIQSVSDLEDIKLLHQAKDDSEPDAIQADHFP